MAIHYAANPVGNIGIGILRILRGIFRLVFGIIRFAIRILL